MRMSVAIEEWPLARDFKISRSVMTVSNPVVVTLQERGQRGRGETEIHDTDYGLIEAGAARLRELRPVVEKPGFTREALAQILPPGPLRSALDCAMWDLEAKLAGKPAWQLAGLDEPGPINTVYTISVDDPTVMAEQAAGARHLPQLKVKLKGAGDMERLQAVRVAAPACRLIVDANEAWTFEQLKQFAPRCAELGVELIEQPLPRGQDQALKDWRSPVPLCADESCHDTPTLADVVGKYEFINIKLDKTGGLTEAINLYREAKRQKLGIMVGCMVGTSLAMAPAMLIAQYARFVDLDGPLLLKRDREPGIVYRNGVMSPAPAELWG